MRSPTRLELRVVLASAKFMFPNVLAPDHAVPIDKNSHTLKITFTISKYPTETLGQLLREVRHA